ncbi:MAG: hypothetical protein ABIF11_05495 [Nitrospirota bacterium]
MSQKSIKKLVHWTKKIINCHKISDTPLLNREGYWKKKEPSEIKVNKE